MKRCGNVFFFFFYAQFLKLPSSKDLDGNSYNRLQWLRREIDLNPEPLDLKFDASTNQVTFASH